MSEFLPITDRPYLTAGQVRQRYGGRSAHWLVLRKRDPSWPAPIIIGVRPFWNPDSLDDFDRLHVATRKGGAE